MKNTLLIAAALAAALVAPGCAFVAGAAIGAGVVHVASEDTTEVVLETSYDTVFVASADELREKGVVEASDADTGRVEGTVGSSTVTITVTRETENSVRVSIKARKNGGISPDQETAEQLSYGVLRRAG